jgi:hypothetical protein
MAPIVTRIASAIGAGRPARLGECMVCHRAVRDGDDRMRVHGGLVHTACAGYRLRRRAGRSRVRGSRNAKGRSPGINRRLRRAA